MTRADVITRLRQHLPMLRPLGITGLSLAGTRGRDDSKPWDEIEVVLDIDLDAHPKFDMLALGGVKVELEDELGVTVWPYVLKGMRDEGRADIERDLVRIA